MKIEIKGLEALQNKLRAMAAKARTEGSASVSVGYVANYAVHVHENLEALHGAAYNAAYGGKPGFKSRGPNQQAKFLERPARQLSDDGTLGRMVFKSLRAKQTMAQALLQAGLRIQRESQLIVPVDSGNLRAGAFTRLD